MKWNLTDKQKDLARGIVKSLREGSIGETFGAYNISQGNIQLIDHSGDWKTMYPGDFGTLEVLRHADLLLIRRDEGSSYAECTVTANIYDAVDSNFAGEKEESPIALPHPPEISISLGRLRKLYPAPQQR